MDEDIIKLKRKRRMKRIVIIFVIVLVIGGLIAYWYINNKKQNAIIFETEKVEKGKIVATVSSTGSLSAVITVDVGSQVSGNIQQLFVDYNDHVTTGQILAKIDPTTYEAKLVQSKARLSNGEAQLNQARADLDNARINVQTAEAGIRQAEAAVSKARADLQNAIGAYLSSKALRERSKAELDNRKSEYDRAMELFRRELISRSELDSYEMQYKMSLANYESAKAQVKSSEANVEAAKSNLASAVSSLDAAKMKRESAEAQVRAAIARINTAEATIEQARGDVEQAKADLDRCAIRSPIDGIVINRKVDVGNTVQASFQSPTLFTLAKNLEQMEVKASVDEADIGKVKQGQKVSFTVDAYPEETFSGEVFQVRTNPNVEQSVVTYDVIVRTDNKNLKLKPGMTANIDITVETKDNVLKIPNSALRFRPERVANFPFPEDVKKEMKNRKNGGEKSGSTGVGRSGAKTGIGSGAKSGKGKEKLDTTIWVLQNGKPVRVKIATGISDSQFTEVKEGDLKEGMEVITDAYTAKERATKEKTRKKMTIRL